jgi:hypothetical protein
MIKLLNKQKSPYAVIAILALSFYSLSSMIR